MKTMLSNHWLLAAAIWYAANGLLHDLFVIRAHKGGYDRELLRLLMDGHVLLLSGALAFISWHMSRSNPQYAGITGFAVAAGMVVYCAMIFPFLKSFVTLLISLILAAVCIRLWMSGALQAGHVHA